MLQRRIFFLVSCPPPRPRPDPAPGGGKKEETEKEKKRRRRAGIVQWLERRTRDWKGRGFESLQQRWENFPLQGQLSVLTLISVSVPPPCYRRSAGHSAKSAGGRLQLNTHAPYGCGFAWSDMVHGCMVYTERAETAAVPCSNSHASAVSTPFRWISPPPPHTHTHRAMKSYSLVRWDCLRNKSDQQEGRNV